MRDERKLRQCCQQLCSDGWQAPARSLAIIFAPSACAPSRDPLSTLVSTLLFMPWASRKSLLDIVFSARRANAQPLCGASARAFAKTRSHLHVQAHLRAPGVSTPATAPPSDGYTVSASCQSRTSPQKPHAPSTALPCSTSASPSPYERGRRARGGSRGCQTQWEDVTGAGRTAAVASCWMRPAVSSPHVRHRLDPLPGREGHDRPTEGPRSQVANFLTAVVAHASDFDRPSETPGPFCFKCRKRDQSVVDTAIDAQWRIVWFCPVCHTEGQISNWEHTFWDLSEVSDES